MEIDHIFVMIAPPAQGDAMEMTSLEAFGLTQTYRRLHPGQGTQNVCLCFDNLFLELLWVNDVTSVRSAQIARTKLYERSEWRANGSDPFGIAWRGTFEALESPPSTWRYEPTYLPAGAAIEVAVDSDDPRQPMMFQSPGGSPPIDWPLEKKGALQHAGGWSRVLGVDLFLPISVAPSGCLKLLAAQTMLNVQVASDDQFSMNLHVENHGQSKPSVLRLPYL